MMFDGSAVTTLTNNTFNDIAPRVNGDQVVWSGRVPVSIDFDLLPTYEIFKYNGSSITTLTANNVDDLKPSISGNNVAWARGNGVEAEIMLHNGSVESTITSNNIEDDAPEVSGGNIAWIGQVGADSDMFFYNGSQVTTLSDDDVFDGDFSIDAGRVVWQKGFPSGDIMFFNGVAATNITGSRGGESHPRLSGNQVVWSVEGVDSEIQLYDGSATVTITENGANDSEPEISDGNVFWVGSDGDDEIFTLRTDEDDPVDPQVVSPSHQVGVSSSDPTIDIEMVGATDTGTGVAGYSIRWSQDTSSQPSTDSVNFPTGGTTTETTTSAPLGTGDWWFNLSTRDKAGNWTETVHLGPFKIDTTLPTGAMQINGGSIYTKSPDVTLDMTFSDTGSGPRFVNAMNDGESPTGFIPYLAAKPWVLPSANGTRKVWVNFRDAAGNESGWMSDTIILDTVAPSGAISINSGNAYTKVSQVTLSLSADDLVSGVEKMRLREGALETPWQSFSSLKGWTFNNFENGVKPVWVQFMDRAGNVSTEYGDSILLDTQGPKAAVSLAPGIARNQGFTVGRTGNDGAGGSGVKNYDIQYKRDKSGAWINWFTSYAGALPDFKKQRGHTYYFRARARDKAGNLGAWSQAVRKRVPNDQDDMILSRSGFSGFKNIAESDYYLGTVRYAETAGANIRYKFTGNYISLIGTQGPKRGTAGIYMDGKLMHYVDAKADKLKYRQVLYEKYFNVSGAHVIKIVNMATKNRPRFDIDGVATDR